jgi:Reduced folate carrier
MYAKVEKHRYQQVTGNARAAILCGRFIASLTAQLLFSFDVMDFRELNFLTLGGFKDFLLSKTFTDSIFCSSSGFFDCCHFIALGRHQPLLLRDT